MSGRIRTIKPEWLDDEKLSACSPAARVLSIGLILLADDYGNGRASESYLKAQVFRHMRGRSSLSALQELIECAYCIKYTVSEQDYYHLCKWSKHQRVEKPSKPRVPGPNLASVSGVTREGLAPDLRPPTSDQGPPTTGEAPPVSNVHSDPTPIGAGKHRVRDPIRCNVFIEMFNRLVRNLGGSPVLARGLDLYRVDTIVERCRAAGITEYDALLVAWFSPEINRPTHTLEALDKAAASLIEKITRDQRVSTTAPTP